MATNSLNFSTTAVVVNDIVNALFSDSADISTAVQQAEAKVPSEVSGQNVHALIATFVKNVKSVVANLTTKGVASVEIQKAINKLVKRIHDKWERKDQGLDTAVGYLSELSTSVLYILENPESYLSISEPSRVDKVAINSKALRQRLSSLFSTQKATTSEAIVPTEASIKNSINVLDSRFKYTNFSGHINQLVNLFNAKYSDTITRAGLDIGPLEFADFNADNPAEYFQNYVDEVLNSSIASSAKGTIVKPIYAIIRDINGYFKYAPARASVLTGLQHIADAKVKWQKASKETEDAAYTKYSTELANLPNYFNVLHDIAASIKFNLDNSVASESRGSLDTVINDFSAIGELLPVELKGKVFGVLDTLRTSESAAQYPNIVKATLTAQLLKLTNIINQEEFNSTIDGLRTGKLTGNTALANLKQDYSRSVKQLKLSKATDYTPYDIVTKVLINPDVAKYTTDAGLSAQDLAAETKNISSLVSKQVNPDDIAEAYNIKYVGKPKAYNSLLNSISKQPELDILADKMKAVVPEELLSNIPAGYNIYTTPKDLAKGLKPFLQTPTDTTSAQNYVEALYSSGLISEQLYHDYAKALNSTESLSKELEAIKNIKAAKAFVTKWQAQLPEAVYDSVINASDTESIGDIKQALESAVSAKSSSLFSAMSSVVSTPRLTELAVANAALNQTDFSAVLEWAKSAQHALSDDTRLVNALKTVDDLIAKLGVEATQSTAVNYPELTRAIMAVKEILINGDISGKYRGLGSFSPILKSSTEAHAAMQEIGKEIPSIFTQFVHYISPLASMPETAIEAIKADKTLKEATEGALVADIADQASSGNISQMGKDLADVILGVYDPAKYQSKDINSSLVATIASVYADAAVKLKGASLNDILHFMYNVLPNQDKEVLKSRFADFKAFQNLTDNDSINLDVLLASTAKTEKPEAEVEEPATPETVSKRDFLTFSTDLRKVLQGIKIEDDEHDTEYKALLRKAAGEAYRLYVEAEHYEAPSTQTPKATIEEHWRSTVNFAVTTAYNKAHGVLDMEVPAANSSDDVKEKFNDAVESALNYMLEAVDTIDKFSGEYTLKDLEAIRSQYADTLARVREVATSAVDLPTADILSTIESFMQVASAVTEDLKTSVPESTSAPEHMPKFLEAYAAIAKELKQDYDNILKAIEGSVSNIWNNREETFNKHTTPDSIKNFIALVPKVVGRRRSTMLDKMVQKYSSEFDALYNEYHDVAEAEWVSKGIDISKSHKENSTKRSASTESMKKESRILSRYTDLDAMGGQWKIEGGYLEHKKQLDSKIAAALDGEDITAKYHKDANVLVDMQSIDGSSDLQSGVITKVLPEHRYEVVVNGAMYTFNEDEIMDAVNTDENPFE